VLLGALALLCVPLAAHDHWITPATFHPAPNERVDLRLCVGHPSQFEEQIRDPRRIVRFDVLGPQGTKPLPGVDGKSPAGILRARDEGLHVLAFESDHAFVEIAPEKYEQYLEDEGLSDVLAERTRRGETARPGRDSYARCDKAFVRVGAAEPSGWERPVGLTCELVPETDPFTWKAGDELVLRLEFQGEPLADRQVKLMRLTAPFTITLARTDEHGRARFRPESAGGWVASSVHQRRATPEQGLEGDWDGWWASLTFELGASAPPSGARG